MEYLVFLFHSWLRDDTERLRRRHWQNRNKPKIVIDSNSGVTGIMRKEDYDRALNTTKRLAKKLKRRGNGLTEEEREIAKRFLETGQVFISDVFLFTQYDNKDSRVAGNSADVKRILSQCDYYNVRLWLPCYGFENQWTWNRYHGQQQSLAAVSTMLGISLPATQDGGMS